MEQQSVGPVRGTGFTTAEALKSLRERQDGVSRRMLLRFSIGAAVGVWLTEVVAGTIAFAWPNLRGGFGGRVTVGKLADAVAKPATPGTSVLDGAPAYFVSAHAFVVLVDTDRAYVPGPDPLGDGATTNVRTLYQRCTHLGCKPNFCGRNFWFECPCHGSRYDRLGIKVAGPQYGPAPRSLDRFASAVDSAGVLTINTGKITLGPLPIALGQPGVIPPRSPVGCQ